MYNTPYENYFRDKCIKSQVLYVYFLYLYRIKFFIYSYKNIYNEYFIITIYEQKVKVKPENLSIHALNHTANLFSFLVETKHKLYNNIVC